MDVALYLKESVEFRIHWFPLPRFKGTYLDKLGGGEVALRPGGDVAALDGGGHQVGERVGGGGEGGGPEGGQRGGVLVVVAGGAVVGQRAQGDHLRPRRGQVGHPA